MARLEALLARRGIASASEAFRTLIREDCDRRGIEPQEVTSDPIPIDPVAIAAAQSGAAALKAAGLPMPPLKPIAASPIDSKGKQGGDVQPAKGGKQSTQAGAPGGRGRERRSAA